MLDLLSKRSVVSTAAAALLLVAVVVMLRAEAHRRATAEGLFDDVATAATATADAWWDELLRAQRADAFALRSEAPGEDAAARLADLQADSPATFGMWLDEAGRVVALFPDREEPAAGTSMLGRFSHIDAVYDRGGTAVWATDESVTTSGRVVAVATRVSPDGPALSMAFDLADTPFVDVAAASTSMIEGAHVQLVEPASGIDLLGAAPDGDEPLTAVAPVAEGLLELRVVAPRAAVEAAVGGVIDPVERWRVVVAGMLLLTLATFVPPLAARERRRRQRSRETAAVLALAPMAAVVVAPDGRVASANEAMCRLTGWSESELVGREVAGGLLLDDDLDDETMARLTAAASGVAPPTSVEGPVRVATREGTPVAARMVVSAGTGPDGAPLGMVLQVVDMRAEIRARAALDRARLEAAQFSARVAHDLLNPLTAAAGLAATLRDFDLPADQRELVLDRVTSSLTGAVELVRRLGDTAKRVGDEPWRTTDLREVHERLQLLTAGMLAQTGGSIDLDVVQTEVVLPVDTISTVLANLVDNSLKYRRQHVPPRIVLRTVKDPGRIHLVVADNGLGVSESEREAIFDPGYQLDAGSSGRGHGLAECRRLVELVGGTIHAEGAPGGGLEVHVVLPWMAPTGPVAESSTGSATRASTGPATGASTGPATGASTHADRAQLPSG